MGPYLDQTAPPPKGPGLIPPAGQLKPPELGFPTEAPFSPFCRNSSSLRGPIKYSLHQRGVNITLELSSCGSPQGEIPIPALMNVEVFSMKNLQEQRHDSIQFSTGPGGTKRVGQVLQWGGGT